MFFYRLARRRPAEVTQRIVAMAAAQLGPGCDVDAHFTPRYNPWDQRLCLVPDGDLFARDPRRPRLGRDRHDRPLRRATASASRSGATLARRHRRHRDRPQAQPARRHRARRRRRAVPSERSDGLQGNDAQRRAEPRAQLRLHQRVVDAEGRPDRRLRLPPAAPHGPARRDDRRAAPRPGGRQRAVPQLHLGLRAARARPAAQAGNEEALAGAPELSGDMLALRFGRIDDGVLRFGVAGAPPGPRAGPHPLGSPDAVAGSQGAS